MSDIILYAFPTGPGFFNFSPYCCKVELLLKMAGLSYQTVMPEDYKSFSKGKLPVLQDGDHMIQDSEFIRYYLAAEHGQTLDQGLDDTNKAIGHTVCRMLDERTINAILWTRWVEDAGWNQIRPIFFAGQPDESAEYVRTLMTEGIKNSGFGRHSTNEMKSLVAEDLKAVATLLGDRLFFLSDQPTYLDATIFGFIANLYGTPFDVWTKELVSLHPNLVEYFNRGMELWFPQPQIAAV
ncbi:MAG: glutathione S-transferase family protein [Kordiimonas sp.]